MRVDEHSRRAVWNNSTDKLGNGNHTRLDMHVSIQQARNQIFSFGIHHSRFFTNGMTGIFTDIGNASVTDGNISMRYNFACLHAHPIPIANDQISRDTAHGTIDQSSCVLQPERIHSHSVYLFDFSKDSLIKSSPIQPSINRRAAALCF